MLCAHELSCNTKKMKREKRYNMLEVVDCMDPRNNNLLSGLMDWFRLR